MPTLHITRGLPASGKTTLARAWVAEDPAGRARVNRDDIRAMLTHRVHVPGVTEERVIAARDATVRALLAKDVDVICDDTNLPQRVARDLATLAYEAGADLAVLDLSDVPVDVCVERDAARPAPVGEARIRDMWTRYLKGRIPLPVPEPNTRETVGGTPYEPKPGTPRVVLVDIDGTVAQRNGRGPFDESRVDEDLPNAPVIGAVQALHAAGNKIVFLSGRSENCRAATARWLGRHLGRIGAEADLLMRAAGDARKDSIVKVELFDAHIRESYDVALVLDDRDQVVRAWRALGLTCLQVAEGNF